MTRQAGTTVADALAQARSRYAASNPGSRAAFESACADMPGGNTRTVLFHEPFPLRIRRGEGARLWDVDGHEYLDFLGDFTAGLFGHSEPAILDAMRRALDGGLTLSGHNTWEARLAAGIRARFPSIDLVRFTNSGTEANLLAVALAVATTGRSRVLVFDGAYHGSLLAFDGGGAITNVPHGWVVGTYNDVAGADSIFDVYGTELAAVLVEPMLGAGGCVPGDSEFLQLLRRRSGECGALLIVDEVMTSRLAAGGRQAALGIQADLTTLGKYFGGGASFGAFGGRADLMSSFDPRRPDALAHAGTFNNNVVTMSAGLAALEIFTPAAMAGLNAHGDRLRSRLNELCAGLPMIFTGLGSLMTVHFTSGPVRNATDVAACDPDLKELLYFDLLEAGIYLARRGMIALSLPIDEAACDVLVTAVGDFVERRLPLIHDVGRAELRED
jgi:glutamate-1-semialdehyde 2,1-aminomutase